MSKFIVKIFLTIILVIISGCGKQVVIQDVRPVKEVVPSNEIEKPVGGERDEYGCLGPAGYTWDAEIGACTRSWEIKEENQKRAAKIAVEYVGQQEGLTIAKVTLDSCSGCFSVEFSTKEYQNFRVRIHNWEAVEKIIIDQHGNKETDIEIKSRQYCNKQDVDQVYVCGSYIKVVSKLAGAGSIYYNSDDIEIKCPVVAPDSITEECKELLSETPCREICGNFE